MDRITFDKLPEMVALILEKLERIERVLNSGTPQDIDLHKQMLTAEEAAKFMGISKSTLYKFGLRRQIPVYKPTGGRIYFKKEEIVNYLQKNRMMSNDEIEQEAINYISRANGKRKAQRFK